MEDSFGVQSAAIFDGTEYPSSTYGFMHNNVPKLDLHSASVKENWRKRMSSVILNN